ncbi:hypothetical protein [Prevotella sp.]|uniref:hypothetical protein n=1 Tax=Prevotella sp. TaxID=59823 RepID=UPI00307D3FD0
MKKKKYTKPEISVFQIESQAALASGSEIQAAPTELYTEKEVQNLWERPDRHTIWSD